MKRELKRKILARRKIEENLNNRIILNRESRIKPYELYEIIHHKLYTPFEINYYWGKYQVH